MQLVIAEKPSVARDLARVLGVRGAGKHAIGDARRVITWCIGHLVELEEPAAYDGRWKAWRLDALPMIPQVFRLRPVEGTRAQLRAVSDLLRERRFTEVVNACDAGREGELIFRYVYELAGSRLPVRRLWISSMTDEAIAGGFAALRPGAEYDALGDAARCRSEADWLVGMNATRAVTITRRSDGPATADRAPGPHRGQRGRAARGGRSPVYSIGRVQTPTLAIVVERERAIATFRPRDYWEVRGTFVGGGAGGKTTFQAGWGAPSANGKTVTTRLATSALSAEVVTRAELHGAATDVAGPSVERVRGRKTREPAPQLFDLTSLQRTANRRYAMSATRTLEAAQALYERYKVLTYPRTDSRHLSGDLAGELPKLFRGLAQVTEYTGFAQTLLGDPPARSKRVFDDTKVHDHHAIIPTGKAFRLDALPEDERRILDLVARRFLGVFYPDAEFALTDVTIRVGPMTGVEAATDDDSVSPAATQEEEAVLAALPPTPDRFYARGRVRLVAGWQEVAQIGEAPARSDGGGRGASSSKRPGTDGESENAATLLPLVEGQRLDGTFEATAKQTKPPPRHNEATLLGAMELAGRNIEDEALRAAMKDTGLGTPATRAATIETLVRRDFIARQGKQLAATATGVALIEELPVASLASPELTGSWEARLARVARGQETRAAFMSDIARYVEDVVDAVRGAPSTRSGNRDATRDANAATSPPVTREIAAPQTRAAVAGRRDPSSLTCPRCKQGTLMTGKRGWGCSRWRDGCGFVVWFETSGRRLSEAQLRDLVMKGQTRKSNWPGGGVTSREISGRLVLDPNGTSPTGGARFEPA